MAVVRQSGFGSKIFFFAYLFSVLLTRVNAQDCSASNPCPEGCCSKAGYCGLGPDYCGTGCQANCDRKAECNPGWNVTGFATSQNCPLNVCCSKYGFCGTTKDFCGDKIVKRPSCGKDSHMSRMIGYYEGWSTYTRSCDQFWPEQIPTGAYSHLNFAFASIDPTSFSVVPADDRDKQLYSRLTALKRQDPNLKVFISIGGWAFNDPGATRPIFGELAADETKQKAFFKSLVSFLSTYNFDGVDLDWEYPAADDRGGTQADYANFPAFMKNLKAALKSSGRDGLSITLPASYWYLQHFDLVNLAKNVDWFNVMSYDLHGTWDQGNKWIGPYLNAHTNLTEITDALDLLWRNKISPSQVVMGMAFYGRSFTAQSKSCLDPGCTYLSGGDSGACSKTIGVLLNSEINSTVAQRHISPKLEKNAAVKIATWDDQWVAYDDPDTFQLKTDFARSECMSGVMVWAVSHDTKDAYYSKALANIVGRPVALEDNNDQPFTTITQKVGQCFWTNCNEVCPSGYQTILRGDGDARNGELMLDDSSCNGVGIHTLCCPGDQPKPSCGWYGFNNGRCNKDNHCPQGSTEIGSHSQYCNNGGYEAACCTVDTTAMKLWDTCSWNSAWPQCPPDPPCSGAQSIGVTQAWTGSGGAWCHPDNFIAPSKDYDFSKSGNEYCCLPEKSSPDFNVGTCQIYDDIGFGPSKGNPCLTGCPTGTIRMAMDQWGGSCQKRGGAQSACCRYTAQVKHQQENPLLDQYRTSLQQWIRDQTCANPGKLPPQAISKRELGTGFAEDPDFYNLTARGLEARQSITGSNKPESVTFQLLLAIIAQLDGPAMLGPEKDIWDSAMRSPYPGLQTKFFIPFLNSWDSLEEQGPQEIAHEVICHPELYNSLSNDFQFPASSHSALTCNYTLCDIAGAGTPFCSDDDETEEENDTTGPNDGTGKKRMMSRHLHQLLKRVGKKRKFKVFVDDQEVVETESLTYPQTDDFDENDEIRDEVFQAEDNTDCLNTDIAYGQAGPSGHNTRIHSEHPVELQTIQDYLDAIGNGELSSGNRLPQGRISPQFFNIINDRQFLENNPITGAGGFVSNMPAEQLYNCLGSTTNQAPFLLADKDINLMKALLWGLKNPMAYAKMNKLIKSGNADDMRKAMTAIKKVFLTMKYLRDEKFTNNLLLVLNCVDGVLSAITGAWDSNRQNTPYDHHSAWRNYMRDHLDTMSTRASQWVESWLVVMQNQYGNDQTSLGHQVREMIATFFNFLHDGEFEIPTRGW